MQPKCEIRRSVLYVYIICCAGRWASPSSGVFRAQGRAGMRCRHRLPVLWTCTFVYRYPARRFRSSLLCSLTRLSPSRISAFFPLSSSRLLMGLYDHPHEPSTYFVCCLLLSMLAARFVSRLSSWFFVFRLPICTNSFPHHPRIPLSLIRTNRTNTHIRIASTFNEPSVSAHSSHRIASHRIPAHNDNDTRLALSPPLAARLSYTDYPRTRTHTMDDAHTAQDSYGPPSLLPRLPRTPVLYGRATRGPISSFLQASRLCTVTRRFAGTRVWMYTAAALCIRCNRYDFATLFSLFVTLSPRRCGT